MAEPARLPEEDRPDIRPHGIPDLRGLEGGGESSDPKRGHLSPVPNDGDTKTPSKSSDDSKSLYNPSDLKDTEENPDNSYYNPNGGQRGFFSRRNRGKNNKRPNFMKRSKTLIALGSGVIAGTVGLSTFFFMGIFNLPNFVKNIEQAGFQRYQVDINGRSSKWLQAYMEIRFSEIDDFDHPDQLPKDKDNVVFRSNRVDTNKPLKDWYRTLRASKFEQNLFETKGIKFTSYAYKENGIIKFRAAAIEFPDGKVQFDPNKLGYHDLDALSQADVSKLNGKLNDTFNLTKFDNDKDARAAIKKIVNENDSGWWKAIKRYHVRQDIQNMIGVRKWTFFENKKILGSTPNEWREKRIAYRNKVIVQALPDGSKSGDFIKCLFGVPECKASSDPGNQNADDHSPTGQPRDPDKVDNNNPDNPQPVGDGSGEETLKGAAGAGDLVGKLISKLIAKAGILSMLDSLARFDKALHDHTLTKIITQTKTAQAIGYFTVFEVASDQTTTGQQNSSEVNAFMQQFQHPTNNEGWTTVVAPNNGNGSVSAASTEYVKAKDKAQFCSDKHQAEMKAHPVHAENEFQYSCAKNKIGAKNNAQALEDEWNSGVGGALHPVLKKYNQATGGVFNVFNEVASAVTEPIVNGAFEVTGTQDDVKRLSAVAGAKALEFGGADNMGVTDESPSGQLAMVALQGAAGQGEASMRDQGAASTTPESRQDANDAVMTYQADQRHNSDFYTRYLSPSNPKSLFATEFFAITTNFDNVGRNFLGVFASALSNSLKALTQPAHAAVPNGYGASNFAGIDTFDFPSQCLDSRPLEETPQSVTNADDLGILKPEELTWDLVNNKKAWYDALYAKVGDDEDKAKTVWNCALLDNTVRGGMSAQYGYTGENSLPNQGGAGGGGGAVDTTVVSGDAQQLAQEILANDKISKTGRYVTEDLQHTANGVPAYGNITLNLKILQFIADLGKTTSFTISSITGDGCGHALDANGVSVCVSDGGNSKHYFGQAVDFSCGFDEAKADEIGKKYGIMADNERCDDGINHSHFSDDGF